MAVSKQSDETAFFKHEFEVMHREISQVKDCLLGNDFNEGKGLVNQFSDLTKRIDMLEETYNKYKNILIGLSMGSGVGLAAIARLVIEAFIKR